MTKRGVIKMEHMTYTVKSCDNLSGISAKVYGTHHHWESIYADNIQEIGTDPNTLHTGVALRIRNKPLSRNQILDKRIRYYERVVSGADFSDGNIPGELGLLRAYKKEKQCYQGFVALMVMILLALLYAIL